MTYLKKIENKFINFLYSRLKIIFLTKMNSNKNYIKDKIEFYLKYEKYEKMTSFLKKNNIEENEMADIISSFSFNEIVFENTLEYSDLIKSDILLEKLISVVKINIKSLKSNIIVLILYFLIFSKKTNLYIDFVNFINKSTIYRIDFKSTPLILSYMIGSKDLMIFYLENMEESEIIKFFWTYNPGLLKYREECDEYILTESSLEKYLQNIEQKKSIAKILNKLKMKNNFENECIKNFVEIYNFVSKNKEYFGVE